MSQESNRDFLQVLDEIEYLYEEKNYQYASDLDPLGNFRRASAGLSKLLSVDCNDEYRRMQAYALALASKQWDGAIEIIAERKTGTVDSLEEKLMDIAIYAIICITMERRRNEKMVAGQRAVEDPQCGAEDQRGPTKPGEPENGGRAGVPDDREASQLASRHLTARSPELTEAIRAYYNNRASVGIISPFELERLQVENDKLVNSALKAVNRYIETQLRTDAERDPSVVLEEIRREGHAD